MTEIARILLFLRYDAWIRIRAELYSFFYSFFSQLIFDSKREIQFQLEKEKQLEM